MADNAEKKQSWWLTLPGILAAITACITAVTGLVVGLKQVGLFGTDVSPTTTSAPAPVTSIGPRPPSGVPPISLPGVADWQGFLNPRFSFACCNDGDPAAAIEQTAHSHLVICRAGPNFFNTFYYRGIGDQANGGIELPGAVPVSGGGFDVTNQKDGTKYQVRPYGLTILTPGMPPWSEEEVDYTD